VSGEVDSDHLELEETYVLPEFVHHGGDPSDPRIVRMLVEHARLRAGEDDLLDAHIRFEEEEDYPLLRSVLPPEPPEPPEPPSSLPEPKLAPPDGSRRIALTRVLAPIIPLADAAGVTLIVVSIELWLDKIVVRSAARPSVPWTAERRQAELNYSRDRARARVRGEMPPLPPDPDWSALEGTEVRLRDDVGTYYRPHGGGGSGTDGEWRMTGSFTPAPPANATRLFLAAARLGIHEPPVHEVAVDLA
jgi:hypothetical protein